MKTVLKNLSLFSFIFFFFGCNDSEYEDGGRKGVKVTREILKKQLKLLSAFYTATGGDNWTSSSNWNTSKDIRTWKGLTIKNDLVVKIELPNNNLIGSFPAELLGITYLNSLDLSGNQISGSFPADFSDLTQMTSLNLSNNQLTGVFPKKFNTLGYLDNVNLANNDLEGVVPVMNENRNLSFFNVINNASLTGKATDLFPCDLDQELQISGTGIVDDCNVYQKKQREALVDFYEALSGDAWELNTNWNNEEKELGEWKGITVNEKGLVTEIKLAENNLVGEIPADIFENFPFLEKIHLYGNKLNGSLPEGLTDLVKLNYLSVEKNSLSGTVPDLSKTNLNFLRLSYNPDLRGDLSTIIAGCENIKYYTTLDIAGTKIEPCP